MPGKPCAVLAGAKSYELYASDRDKKKDVSLRGITEDRREVLVMKLEKGWRIWFSEDYDDPDSDFDLVTGELPVVDVGEPYRHFALGKV